MKKFYVLNDGRDDFVGEEKDLQLNEILFESDNISDCEQFLKELNHQQEMQDEIDFAELACVDF